MHTDNTAALFHVVNVSNVLLLFIDAFDKLTDKITPSVNNARTVIRFFIYAVNIIIIF